MSGFYKMATLAFSELKLTWKSTDDHIIIGSHNYHKTLKSPFNKGFGNQVCAVGSVKNTN